MGEIITSCREAAIAAILLVPVYWQLNRHKIQDTNRCIVYLTFSIYLAAMYAAVGLPDITYYRYHPHFNFTPFLYMFTDLDTTILNVVLFIPLGFYLPLLWHRFRSFWWTLLIGFSTTVIIELLQIFTFRATDVNDLITNTIGTIIGYTITRILLVLIPRIHPAEDTNDIWIVFGSSFGVMFFLYPFLAKILL